ncbi:MAG: hypothetical protein ACRELX_02025 [Longimicrobiales bacterium]
MATQQQKATLGDLPAALMNLFGAQMRLSADLFESLTGQPAPTAGDVSKLGRTLGFDGSSCRPRSGCCTMPPPCWMPQPLGECVSHVAQCNTACIRLVITNCDRVKRTITVQAACAGAARVTLSPPSVALPPMERATVTACVSIPDDAKSGEKIESLLWVRGCKEYYLRWTVSVGTLGIDSCHEVEVCDCPDHLHHWYDHFYCVQPCPQDRSRVGAATHG